MAKIGLTCSKIWRHNFADEESRGSLVSDYPIETGRYVFCLPAAD